MLTANSIGPYHFGAIRSLAKECWVNAQIRLHHRPPLGRSLLCFFVLCCHELFMREEAEIDLVFTGLLKREEAEIDLVFTGLLKLLSSVYQACDLCYKIILGWLI